jgi:hypothetical protein
MKIDKRYIMGRPFSAISATTASSPSEPRSCQSGAALPNPNREEDQESTTTTKIFFHLSSKEKLVFQTRAIGIINRLMGKYEQRPLPPDFLRSFQKVIHGNLHKTWWFTAWFKKLDTKGKESFGDGKAVVKTSLLDAVRLSSVQVVGQPEPYRIPTIVYELTSYLCQDSNSDLN